MIHLGFVTVGSVSEVHFYPSYFFPVCAHILLTFSKKKKYLMETRRVGCTCSKLWAQESSSSYAGVVTLSYAGVGLREFIKFRRTGDTELRRSVETKVSNESNDSANTRWKCLLCCTYVIYCSAVSVWQTGPPYLCGLLA